MGTEDESEDKKVVVPPANQALQPPVYHVELQFDATQLALRKALPNHMRLRSVARATYLRRSWSVHLVRKLDAGQRDVVRAVIMLPERSSKQQQQQLSQKASARQTITVGD